MGLQLGHGPVDGGDGSGAVAGQRLRLAQAAEQLDALGGIALRLGQGTLGDLCRLAGLAAAQRETAADLRIQRILARRLRGRRQTRRQQQRRDAPKDIADDPRQSAGPLLPERPL